MNKQKHTPTPWIIGKNSFGIIGSNDNNDTWQEILVMNKDNSKTEANAAFIVKACNNHERLVAYIKNIARAIDVGSGTMKMTADEHTRLLEFIAAIEEDK